VAGKRYEAEDQTGKRVWLQDGIEVHEADAGGYRTCFDPGRVREDSAWVPGTFDTVDAAFAAGRVARSLAKPPSSVRL